MIIFLLMAVAIEPRPGGCAFDPRLRRTILFGVFSPLSSDDACKKSSMWLWKESCASTGVRKPGNTGASLTAMI